MQSGHFKEKSFWLSTRDYTPGRPLQEDAKLDVAIVGGGFTGLSAEEDAKLDVAIVGGGFTGLSAATTDTMFCLPPHRFVGRLPKKRSLVCASLFWKAR